MNLAEARRAIRPLLDEDRPEDGMAAYFAFYYAAAKTTLRSYGPELGRADGYVCLSRTGMDLFRPLVTMRLPIDDLQLSAQTLQQALTPHSPLILSAPESYGPLLNALFDIQGEEQHRLFALRANQFEPIINVLITQDTGVNGLPRYLIRDRQNDNVLVAAAGLNWQTRRFAEISVNTHPNYRRQGYGRSVVAAMADHLLANGRTPLYVVSEQNQASIQLAQQVGFHDTLTRQLMIQGNLKTAVD